MVFDLPGPPICCLDFQAFNGKDIVQWVEHMLGGQNVSVYSPVFPDRGRGKVM